MEMGMDRGGDAPTQTQEKGQTGKLRPKGKQSSDGNQKKVLITPSQTRNAGISSSFTELADSMRDDHQGLNLMILNGGQTSTVQQLLTGPLLKEWFKSIRDLTNFRRDLDQVLYTLYKLHKIRILQTYSGNSPRPT